MAFLAQRYFTPTPEGDKSEEAGIGHASPVKLPTLNMQAPLISHSVSCESFHDARFTKKLKRLSKETMLVPAGESFRP